MFGTINSGYVGASRSVRSEQAIEDYEVPMSFINKDLINDFVSENEEYEDLEKLPVYLWKFGAESVGASSWHHTGKYFNETDHYSLYKIASFLKYSDLKAVKLAYKQTQADKKQAKQDAKNGFKYIVIDIKMFGGTRRHPHYLGTERKAGIRIGDWAYDLDGDRHNVYARKTDSFTDFDSYKDLVKVHKDYKGNVKKFNKLIRDYVK